MCVEKLDQNQSLVALVKQDGRTGEHPCSMVAQQRPQCMGARGVEGGSGTSSGTREPPLFCSSSFVAALLRAAAVCASCGADVAIAASTCCDCKRSTTNSLLQILAPVMTQQCWQQVAHLRGRLSFQFGCSASCSPPGTPPSLSLYFLVVVALPIISFCLFSCAYSNAQRLERVVGCQ